MKSASFRILAAALSASFAFSLPAVDVTVGAQLPLRQHTMDVNTIRDAFQHVVLVGCGVGLLTMSVGGIVYGLSRMPGRIGKGAA